MQTLNEKYGLEKRTELEVLGPNQIGIVKCIKSRIVIKDAEKIVEMAKAIKTVEPETKVYLICFNNICSKSLALLESNDIETLITEE